VPLIRGLHSSRNNEEGERWQGNTPGRLGRYEEHSIRCDSSREHDDESSVMSRL
jgi:hypothetical protein